jgi:hypothetical protein
MGLGKADINGVVELGVQLDNQRTLIPGGETLVGLRVANTSPAAYYDFGDGNWKTAGWGTQFGQLSEFDSTNEPGYYNRVVDVGASGGAAKPVAGDIIVATYQVNATSPTLDATVSDVWFLEDPTADAAALVDAVWDEAKAGHVGAGSFGEEVQSHSTSSEVASVQADTDDIQTRLPAALVGGRMDADVGNMQANTVDANALATDAVNEIVAALLAAVLTGSSESVDTALSRLDNIDADVATNIPALIAALNDLSIADVQTALTNQGYTAARAPNLDNLDALVSSRSSHSAADVDTVLTAAHGAGSWTSLAQTQFDLRQGWSRRVNPSSEMRGIIHLEQNGDRVTLPGGAACTFQAYDRAGSAIAGFSGSGTLRTVGSDTFFDVSAAYTPVAGEAITVQATITGSGVGGGTHVNFVEIAFPEF